MAGLTEPFSLPLFTDPNADYCPVLSGSHCAEVSVGHSRLQQKVGRLTCPGGYDHLQRQLGMTACCSLSHYVCTRKSLLLCYTFAARTVKVFTKHGLVTVGKQGCLDCFDGIWLALHPAGKETCFFPALVL